MIEMRGDSVHLFVLEARSWSDVGSTKLRWRRNDCQPAIHKMEWRNGIANVLHELERRTGTPGGMVKHVIKEHVICQDGVEETFCICQNPPVIIVAGGKGERD
jgi:hypothetical protein